MYFPSTPLPFPHSFSCIKRTWWDGVIQNSQRERERESRGNWLCQVQIKTRFPRVDGCQKMPINSGAFFDTRQLGPSKNAPEFTGRQLGPWTRVVETGLKECQRNTKVSAQYFVLQIRNVDIDSRLERRLEVFETALDALQEYKPCKNVNIKRQFEYTGWPNAELCSI